MFYPLVSVDNKGDDGTELFEESLKVEKADIKVVLPHEYRQMCFSIAT